MSGSAAPAGADHERLARATGPRVVERYGMTETLMNCAVRADGERRAGTVGPALDGAACLSRHKRPREVQFLDWLPRNGMGTVMTRASARPEPGDEVRCRPMF